MNMKRGFTLLEVMVATMLLAMLVTILTMIFNQSSIAWTTGTASIAGLGDVRRDMAIVGLKADNLLDPMKRLQVVSVWADGDAKLKAEGRTVDRQGLSDPLMQDPAPSEKISVGSGSAAGKDSYVVGVSSDGPDGIKNTWDDITTMPQEVD